MARIGVNTRLLLKDKLEGIGSFTLETLSRICRQHPEHEFFFFFDRPFDPSFIFSSNVTPVVAFPQARHPLLYIWYFEWSLPRLFKKHNIDFFLSPDGYCSLRSQVPTLAVIHDINFEHRPKDLPLKDRLYYRFFFPLFAKHAGRIATVSNYSKTDISITYGIHSGNIDVVYNGCNSLYQPVAETTIHRTRQQWTQGKPYFIFIGSLHPRKNLINLIQAFQEFYTRHGSTHYLVLVGNFMWKDDLKKLVDALPCKKQLILTGRLSNEELHPLLASAEAMTYVPFFEGFGIPILEAFSAGIPVISSNTTSMPEVAGEAALLVNPESIQDITEAMITLADNPRLRTDLVKAGHKQLLLFSWDRSADLLWKSMKQLMVEVWGNSKL